MRKAVISTLLFVCIVLAAAPAPEHITLAKEIQRKEIVKIRFYQGAASAAQLEEWQEKWNDDPVLNGISDWDKRIKYAEEVVFDRPEVYLTAGAVFDQYAEVLRKLEFRDAVAVSEAEMMGFPLYEQWFFPKLQYCFSDGTSALFSLDAADPDFLRVQGENYQIFLQTDWGHYTYFFNETGLFTAEAVNRIACGA